MSGEIEIFLQPGEWFFGDRDTRIRTLLGSCVSLVLWHPGERLGGMCHYMLPTRPRPGDGPLDGRYGDEALALLFDDIRKTGTHPQHYRARIFGGADMFPGMKAPAARRIGRENVLLAHELLAHHGLTCVASHVEGTVHRYVIFDVNTGKVTMKRAMLRPALPRIAYGKSPT